MVSRAKHFLALALAVCMVFTFLPVTSAKASATPVDYREVAANTVSLDQTVEDGNLVEEEEEPDANEVVRVVIVFSDKSVTENGYSTHSLSDNQKAMAYIDKVKASQEKTISRIESKALDGQDLDVVDQFTITANAVAANVRYGQIEEIKAVSGVADVYLDPMYELDPPVADTNTATSGEMVGSYSAWADGYTGAGSRIAIIDTGIDRDHDSFDEDAFYYGLGRSAAKFGKDIADYDLLTVEDVAAVLPQLHVAGSDALNLGDNPTAEKCLEVAQSLYTSAKLPFGYDYLANSTDYNCDSTSGDHGCHVSGIAAANAYVPTLDEDGDTYYAPQANGVTGIAPDAQILTMKVFSGGYGAYETNYMAAIEDAILLGCDSINLSLGSSIAGRSYSTSYGKLLDSLTDTDTVVTMSAGNSGAWADNEINGVGLTKTGDVRTNTGGSPGSYTNSFTIASITNIGMTGIMGTFNGISVVPNDTAATYGAQGFEALDTTADHSGTEYEYVFVGDPTTGTGIYGEEADFAGLDLTGKVALISRGGGVSFYVKANNAVAAGAVATVVYNNVDGTINMNLTGYEYTAPCVNISLAEANQILAASEKNADGLYAGKVTVIGKCNTVINEEGYKPSSFSSWGTTENLALKPEITAPGGNIYSTLDGNTYGNNSGTSMSAPSVTGAAAVVAQYIKENGLDEKTGLNVRTLAIALLMSTAKPLVDSDTDTPYSPRLQGSGLDQVYEAVTSPAYLLVGQVTGKDADNNEVVVNDGKVKMEFGDDPQRTGVYSDFFSIHNMTEEPLRYSLDSIITTMAVEVVDGEEYMSKSTYELHPDVSFATDAEASLVYDLNGDGKVDWQDALALLKVANGTADTLGEKAAAVYDLDQDGSITSTDAQLLLAAVNGDTSTIDAQAVAYTVPAGGSIEVTATITLSQADKAYLEEHYANGCYVEGYLYVNSAMGDGKQMSIPVLGFYGNWTDPSMFEHVNYLEDSDKDSYDSYTTATGQQNFYSIRYSGSTSEYFLAANGFATDEEYIADRNAIANTSSLYKGYPSLIRGADNVSFTVTDAETGEVYFTKSGGTSYGAYYSSSNSAWGGTASSFALSWNVTDQENKKLPEGTKLLVTCQAVPEYYWDRENAATTGELGRGAYWYTTLTVDNTAPVATAINYNVEAVSGKRSVTVTVQDNRYTAAVLLFSKSNTVMARSAVNQTELGAEATVTFDLSEIYTNNFYVVAVDYAGNQRVYEVDFGGGVEAPKANTTVSAMFPNNDGYYFGTLDTDDVSSYQTPMESGLETPLLCAAKAGDGTLYAASHETVGNTLYSTLYKVNSDYSLTAVGARLAGGCTDMTWAPNSDVMLATYGPYILLLDVTTGTMLGSQTMSSYIGGSSAYAVGITYMATANHATYGKVDLFALLSSTGTIYQFGINKGEDGKYTLFTPSAMGNISGLSTSTIAGSGLFYKDGLLYISAFTGKATNLMFVDLSLSTFQTFDIGSIPTAPVSIYDAAPKTENSNSSAVVTAELGAPLTLEMADSVQPQAAGSLLG